MVYSLYKQFLTVFCLFQEAMMEVDVDSSGTVDFYEFLCVARLIAQGKGLKLLTTSIRLYNTITIAT